HRTGTEDGMEMMKTGRAPLARQREPKRRGRPPVGRKEEPPCTPIIAEQRAKARIREWHRQAERGRLVRAARQARTGSRRHAVTRHRPAVLERVRALLNGRKSRPAVQADGAVVYNIDAKVPPSVNKRQVGREIVEYIREFEQGSGKSWRTLT